MQISTLSIVLPIILLASSAQAESSKYGPLTVTEIKTAIGTQITYRVVYGQVSDPRIFVIEQLENDKDKKPSKFLRSWDIQSLSGGTQINTKGNHYISDLEWLTSGNLKFKNDTITGSIITSKECEIILLYDKKSAEKSPSLICHQFKIQK